jgi:hypothetical protein
MRVTAQDIVRRANGTQPPKRHLVAASEIFKRARRDPDADPPADPDGHSNGTPARREASPNGEDQDLARKLAWAVGSSLVIPYGRRTAVHRYFEEHADQLLRDMGLRGG